MKKECRLLVENALLITMNPSRDVIGNGAVAIDGDIVVGVGTTSEIRSEFCPIDCIDAKGAIVHPGFIDAHNHIVHTSCRGVFPDIHGTANSPVNFADWKADVCDEDEAVATLAASLELLRSGFTMFVEPGSIFATDAAAAAINQVGIRALLSPAYLWDAREPFDAIPSLYSESLMARVPISSERALTTVEQELSRNQTPGNRVLGYIFVYGEGTATPQLLIKAHAAAKDHKVPLHLHAGYVPKGAEIYREMTGMNQIEHFAELGILDPRTVLVHANILNEREELLVAETGTQLVWCPTAFFSLGLNASKDIFRMTARHTRGVAISLGSDGAFDATPAANMLSARQISQHFNQPLSPEILLEMQTINAAKAAGLEDSIGSIESGKKADIIIRQANTAEAAQGNNPAHTLGLIIGTGSVDTVLVDGEKIFQSGHSTRVDEGTIAKTLSESIAKRAARLGINPNAGWPVRR